jgi:hypothetical protein
MSYDAYPGPGGVGEPLISTLDLGTSMRKEMYKLAFVEDTRIGPIESLKETIFNGRQP